MLNDYLVTSTPRGLIKMILNRDGAGEAYRMRPVIRVKTENIMETCVKMAGHRIFRTDKPTSSKRKEILNFPYFNSFCVQGDTRQKPQKEVDRFDVP